MPVEMFIDSNAHHADSEYRSGPRAFETLEAALTTARLIVDECLKELHEPGLAAAELFERYVLFGDDPWLAPWDGGPTMPFSAWDYAKERCVAICAATSTNQK